MSATYINTFEITEKKAVKRRNYFLMFLILSIGSMPFFVGNEFLFIYFIIVVSIFIAKKIKIEKFIVYYVIFYFMIFFLQAFFFSAFEPGKVVAYITRIFFAYFTFRIIGNSFSRYYTNVIYFFTILSFVFYVPGIFFPEQVNSILTSISEIISKFQLNDPGRSHVIIYTFGEEYTETSGFVDSRWSRNSGPFWEPGGFGVFLILAFVLELIDTKKILTKKNFVFLLGIITTLSTASFFVIFVTILFYLITYRTPKRILFILFLAVSSVFAYFNAFFLQAKVKDDLSYATKTTLKNSPRTRFVSAQLDFIDFMKYPILGRGRYEATRFDIVESREDLFYNHRNNGTSNMLVEFGITGFLVFFVCTYYSFKNYCELKGWKPIFAVFLLIILLLLGFSQMIFNKPLFIGLSFIFLGNYYEQYSKLKFVKRTTVN